MTESGGEDEEEDIYHDLPEFHFDETIKKYETTNKRLEERISVLEKELKEIKDINSKLEEENRNLNINISSLIKTARNEIQRKTDMIDELRKKCDQLIFRRGKNSQKSRNDQQGKMPMPPVQDDQEYTMDNCQNPKTYSSEDVLSQPPIGCQPRNSVSYIEHNLNGLPTVAHTREINISHHSPGDISQADKCHKFPFVPDSMRMSQSKIVETVFSSRLRTRENLNLKASESSEQIQDETELQKRDNIAQCYSQISHNSDIRLKGDRCINEREEKTETMNVNNSIDPESCKSGTFGKNSLFDNRQGEGIGSAERAVLARESENSRRSSSSDRTKVNSSGSIERKDTSYVSSINKTIVTESNALKDCCFRNSDVGLDKQSKHNGYKSSSRSNRLSSVDSSSANSDEKNSGKRFRDHEKKKYQSKKVKNDHISERRNEYFGSGKSSSVRMANSLKSKYSRSRSKTPLTSRYRIPKLSPRKRVLRERSSILDCNANNSNVPRITDHKHSSHKYRYSSRSYLHGRDDTRFNHAHKSHSYSRKSDARTKHYLPHSKHEARHQLGQKQETGAGNSQSRKCDRSSTNLHRGDVDSCDDSSNKLEKNSCSAEDGRVIRRKHDHQVQIVTATNKSMFKDKRDTVDYVVLENNMKCTGLKKLPSEQFKTDSATDVSKGNKHVENVTARNENHNGRNLGTIQESAFSLREEMADSYTETHTPVKHGDKVSMKENIATTANTLQQQRTTEVPADLQKRSVTFQDTFIPRTDNVSISRSTENCNFTRRRKWKVCVGSKRSPDSQEIDAPVAKKAKCSADKENFSEVVHKPFNMTKKSLEFKVDFRNKNSSNTQEHVADNSHLPSEINKCSEKHKMECTEVSASSSEIFTASQPSETEFDISCNINNAEFVPVTSSSTNGPTENIPSMSLNSERESAVVKNNPSVLSLVNKDKLNDSKTVPDTEMSENISETRSESDDCELISDDESNVAVGTLEAEKDEELEEGEVIDDSPIKLCPGSTVSHLRVREHSSTSRRRLSAECRRNSTTSTRYQSRRRHGDPGAVCERRSPSELRPKGKLNKEMRKQVLVAEGTRNEADSSHNDYSKTDKNTKDCIFSSKEKHTDRFLKSSNEVKSVVVSLCGTVSQNEIYDSRETTCKSDRKYIKETSNTVKLADGCHFSHIKAGKENEQGETFISSSVDVSDKNCAEMKSQVVGGPFSEFEINSKQFKDTTNTENGKFVNNDKMSGSKEPHSENHFTAVLSEHMESRTPFLPNETCNFQAEDERFRFSDEVNEEAGECYLSTKRTDNKLTVEANTEHVKKDDKPQNLLVDPETAQVNTDCSNLEHIENGKTLESSIQKTLTAEAAISDNAGSGKHETERSEGEDGVQKYSTIVNANGCKTVNLETKQETTKLEVCNPNNVCSADILDKSNTEDTEVFATSEDVSKLNRKKTARMTIKSSTSSLSTEIVKASYKSSHIKHKVSDEHDTAKDNVSRGESRKKRLHKPSSNKFTVTSICNTDPNTTVELNEESNFITTRSRAAKNRLEKEKVKAVHLSNAADSKMTVNSSNDISTSDTKKTLHHTVRHKTTKKIENESSYARPDEQNAGQRDNGNNKPVFERSTVNVGGMTEEKCGLVTVAKDNVLACHQNEEKSILNTEITVANGKQLNASRKIVSKIDGNELESIRHPPASEFSDTVKENHEKDINERMCTLLQDQSKPTSDRTIEKSLEKEALSGEDLLKILEGSIESESETLNANILSQPESSNRILKAKYFSDSENTPQLETGLEAATPIQSKIVVEKYETPPSVKTPKNIFIRRRVRQCVLGDSRTVVVSIKPDHRYKSEGEVLSAPIQPAKTLLCTESACATPLSRAVLEQDETSNSSSSSCSGCSRSSCCSDSSTSTSSSSGSSTSSSSSLDSSVGENTFAVGHQENITSSTPVRPPSLREESPRDARRSDSEKETSIIFDSPSSPVPDNGSEKMKHPKGGLKKLKYNPKNRTKGKVKK